VITQKERWQRAHGSVLAVTCSGVFLKVLMSVASWATRRADSSRSFATLVASLPVSFWTFCERNYIKSDMIPMCATAADFDMSLYLYAQFLKMLHYGTIDCTTEVGVLICDDTGFVADAIIYILTVTAAQSHKWVVRWPPSREISTHLKTTFAKELISRAEGYLNDGGKFSHLLRSVVLNVGNTLEQPNSWIVVTNGDNREIPRSKQ
jgi:hypothetical protein